MTQITLFQQRKEYFLSAIFLGIIFLNFSCKKPEEQIGSEVQPQDGKLNFERTDTFSLFAYSVYEDSIITGGVSVGTQTGTVLASGMLGAYEDPVFGYTASEIYTQLELEDIKPEFSTDLSKIIIDSVFLSLKYEKDYYGTINAVQNLVVNELIAEFNDSTLYFFNNDSIAASPENLVYPGKESISFNPNRPMPYDTTETPHLKVQLKNSFADKILKATPDKLQDQKTFKQFIKGIKISSFDPNPLPGTGGLFTFNLLDDTSRITIHYRDLVVSDTISKVFKLDISKVNVKRFERLKHNYTNTEVGNDIAQGPAFNRSKVYIQSLAGVNSVLKIPHIDHLKGLNIAINKAELIMPALVAENEKFKPSSRLDIYQLLSDTADAERLIIDCSSNSGLPHALRNGIYNSETKEYRINMTLHMQYLLNDTQKNYGFNIKTSLPRSEANRTVLYGPAHIDPLKKMRLEITYTTYNP